MSITHYVSVDHHVTRDDMCTYLDLTRKQALHAMSRFASNREYAERLVRIEIIDNVVWIG